MAQPTAVQYIGAERITSGVTYTSDDIITKYGAGTNVMQAKIDNVINYYLANICSLL
jgi:hypothetical protein